MVNTNYIVGALGKFFKKNFRQKKPLMAKQEWFFLCENAPVHSAAIV